MDGKWIQTPPGSDIEPVMDQIRTMSAKARGVIAMKSIGNRDFVEVKDRKNSVRFAMAHDEINAVVIGFTNRKEIDEAIGLWRVAERENGYRGRDRLCGRPPRTDPYVKNYLVRFLP